jgi:hypothetical protein
MKIKFLRKVWFKNLKMKDYYELTSTQLNILLNSDKNYQYDYQEFIIKYNLYIFMT